MASGLDAARQTLVLHAGFEQANVSHIRLAHSPIGELIEQCPRRIGEASLTDWARTHRGLPLPGGGPPLRILTMRLDRAAHRAVLALGSQVEVDDNAQLIGRRAEEVLHAVHNRRRTGRRFRLGGTPDGLV